MTMYLYHENYNKKRQRNSVTTYYGLMKHQWFMFHSLIKTALQQFRDYQGLHVKVDLLG